MRWLNRMGAALAVATLCAAGHGQTGAPIEIPYALSSGPRINDSASPQIVWTGYVDVPFAGTLQPVFQSAILGGLVDAVIVESALDGEIQELDAPTLQLWRHQTAWFNGTRVAVKLRLGPGSFGAVDITTVRAGPPSPAGLESLCGSDDRVSSSDGRVCRLYGNGGVCTGWLVNENSQILTAGHCVNCPSICPSCATSVSSPGALVVAQFNVPQSTSSGAIVAPAVQYQFPVQTINISWPVSGVCPETGNDWAIATLGPNSSAVSASTSQGGWITLANYAPAAGSSVRVTGFGFDSTPAISNYTQQTATGPVVNASAYYRYAVDTEGGTSGGPVTVDGGQATGQAVAINTNSGCTLPPTSGNGGTSLQGSTIRNVLYNYQIVDNWTLADGVTQSIFNANSWFSLAFGAGKWNAVVIVPDGSWDLSIAQSVSDGAGTAVEALLSNGHLGTPWTAGTAYRKAVTAGARMQHAVAETFTAGTAASGSLTGTRLARLLEFQVPAAGVYNVAINGSSGLRFAVMGPGTDALWVKPQVPSVIAAGAIGGGVSSALPLAAGWHAVLINRANSAAVNTTESYFVSVCASGPPALALQEGVPAAVTPACQAFATPAASGQWKVVGLASPSVWDTYIGMAASRSNTGGNLVLADGRAGAIPNGQGLFSRRSGADPAVAEYWRATTSIPDTAWSFTLPAGAVLRAFEFNVTTAGTWTVHVTGPAGLGWRIYAPQTSGTWIDIDDHYASGLMGNVPLAIPLQTGWHCLVVHRLQGVSAAPVSGSVTVCSGSVLGLSSGGNGIAVTNACQMISLGSTSGVWDAVAIDSDTATNWDLHHGTADATGPSGTCDLAVSDGHAAPFTMPRGVVNRVSGTGSGFVQQPGRSTLTPGTALPLALNASTIAHIVEVPIAAADTFDLFVTGTVGLAWDFFTPRANASWVTRAAAQVANQPVNGPAASNVPLQPGVHAFVIYRLAGTGATSCSVNVLPGLHPVPALSSMSPTSTPATVPVPVLTLIGSGFDSSAQVRWNGAAIPTSFVNSNQLTAAPPSSLLATGVAAAITVFNPTPGGGTSNPLTFSVVNPAPAITLVSQTTLTAGSPGYTTTVIGTGFTTGTVIRWNGTPLATVLSFPPNLIDVAVPASLIAFSGTASITAFNPAPGGGTSAPVTVTVTNPVPGLALLGPGAATAGGAGFTMSVNGTGFMPSTVIRWNGSPLTQVQAVLPGQIDVAVPASLIAIAGTASVTAFSPAPGGGGSAPLTFTINNPAPSVTALAPSSVPAGGPAFTLAVTGAGFNAQSVVRIGTTNLATVFGSPTQLQAAVPASAIATGGPQAVSVFNPAPGGGGSGSVNLDVTHPVPVLSGLSVTSVIAGSPATSLVATGSGFTAASQISILGTPRPTTLLTATTLESVLTAADLAAPGSIPVAVLNPAPGGGSSATLPITARAPVLATLAPATIPVRTLGSPALTLTITGADFLPGAGVYANGVPLATVSGGTTLTASLPSSIPQAREPGGIAINVANGTFAVSNTRALVVGGGSNAGTIRRHPLDPAPGQAYAAVLEGGTPNAVFSLYVDLGTQPPVTAFPDPAADLVLAVTPYAGSPGPMIPLVEGLGIFGPATLTALLPDGSFNLPGFVVPATPFGIDLTLQAVYLDPSALYGFRLTWARRPDQL